MTGVLTGTLRAVTGLLIGYARVSTDEQDLTAQRDALAALGVDPDRIYVDHGLTGTNRDRPGLREALAACRAGDTLVVTKLDRLARSLPDARDIVDELTAREVKLNLGGSVHDPTDPVGRLLFNVLAMVAEFEADLAPDADPRGHEGRPRQGPAARQAAQAQPRARKPTSSRLHRAGEHTSRRARGAVLHHAVDGVPGPRPRPSPRYNLIATLPLGSASGVPGPHRRSAISARSSAKATATPG